MQETPQKCDAQRPCARCVTAKVASECEYEIIDARPKLLDPPRFIFWDQPDPSTPGDVYPQECWAPGDTTAGPSNNAQGVESATRTVPLALTLAHPPGGSDLPSRGPKPLLHAPSQVMIHKPSPVIIPPFSALLSRIPPEPHITLLLLGGERFQLSDVALEELDMKLYASQFY